MATTDDRRLSSDCRGVVALVGLAMAVFLTALVYYEMGVGDAIAFKEKLQDAADASGFAAAVYHAKGMNMIVLLNLIMAAVLAVIVVLRVLELLFGIVAALVPAICWVPGMEWLCPLEGIADSGLEWTNSAAETMDPIVRTALIGLNDVSTAVAVGMPWVAMIKSGTVGPQYYSEATSSKGGGTVMLSMSLVPDMTWIPAVNGAAASAKGSATGALGLDGGDDSKTAGKRWGLPVQDGEFSYLCDQAGQVVPDLVEWAVNAAVHGDPNASPPKWLSWLNSTIGGLIGSWPQYFCDESAMSTGQVASMVQSQAQSQCDANKQKWDQCVTQIEKYGFGPPTLPPIPSGGGPLGSQPTSLDASSTGPCANGVGAQVMGNFKKGVSTGFDMKGCMSSETAEITKKAQEANGGSAWNAAKNSALPKAMYSFAENGNDYMAVWSFAWGKFADGEEKGVSLAEWCGGGDCGGGTSNGSGGGPSSAPPGVAQPVNHPTMITKAEFYYAVESPCGAPGQDYGTKGSAGLCGTSLNLPYWGDYVADATWNPRWRARLRRVSPPMIPVGQMASSGLGSLLDGALQKGLGMIPKSNVPKLGGPDPSDAAGVSEVTDFITGWLQLGGGYADGAVAGEIEKAAGFLH